MPYLQPDRQPQHHQSMYGRNIFRPYRKPSPPHTCSQPEPSAPKPPINVGAKYFSPLSQPATPHALFATQLVSHNTTNQCRGEIFFARIATSNTADPVRNPIRQPQHHLQTCGRKIFRPDNILPIRITTVTTRPKCPTPPATVGPRCAGVALPRPAQRTYLAKSI